ncbi:MAG: amidohydrolase, partial [Chloroflexi bacterium]|nr:amidohydrolase [Chloroflexota bacterium]
MAAPATSPSAAIRARLDHPVIDSDGHMVEFLAPIEDYVKAIGGSKFAVSFPRAVQRMVGESDEERRRRGGICPPWWNLPAKNSLDRATAALPKLMYERLDEMGID